MTVDAETVQTPVVLLAKVTAAPPVGLAARVKTLVVVSPALAGVVSPVIVRGVAATVKLIVALAAA